MIEGLVIVGMICVVMGVVALFTALAERWEWRNRAYYDDDPLPPPNVRSQRSGRESH